jgi:hypothetical protein
MGAVVVYAKEIKHNVAIDDATFKAKEKKMAAKNKNPNRDYKGDGLFSPLLDFIN